MNNQNRVNQEEILAFAEMGLFSREAILKCLYWYGDKFHTNITQTAKDTYSISLKPLAGGPVTTDELPFYLQKLERDLIDFQLRDTVGKETRNIRDLLVAKAFSNGEFDEEPPGEVSDPVGFNPEAA